MISFWRVNSILIVVRRLLQSKYRDKRFADFIFTFIPVATRNWNLTTFAWFWKKIHWYVKKKLQILVCRVSWSSICDAFTGRIFLWGVNYRICTICNHISTAIIQYSYLEKLWVVFSRMWSCYQNSEYWILPCYWNKFIYSNIIFFNSFSISTSFIIIKPIWSSARSLRLSVNISHFSWSNFQSIWKAIFLCSQSHFTPGV